MTAPAKVPAAARATAGGISPAPSLDPVAMVGLPGRVLDIYSAYGSAPLLLLLWLTLAGAHLGRRVGIRIRGSLLYPNLHIGVENWPAARSVIHVLGAFFEPFGPHPLVAESGVKCAQSLVHLVRDSSSRSEKVATQPYDTPRYRVAEVDRGTVERRLILSQPLAALLDRHTAASASLSGALTATYFGEDLAVFVPAGGATGYELSSSGAHITLISDLVPTFLPSVIFLPNLDADPAAPFTVRAELDTNALTDAQLLFEASVFHQFPPELHLERSAQLILNAAANELAPASPLAEVKLAKLVLTYCLADACDSIKAHHARAAASVLRFCVDVQRHHENQLQHDHLADRIFGVLATEPGGLTTAKLNRRLRTASVTLNAELLALAASGRIVRKVVATDGRDSTLWSAR